MPIHICNQYFIRTVRLGVQNNHIQVPVTDSYELLYGSGIRKFSIRIQTNFIFKKVKIKELFFIFCHSLFLHIYCYVLDPDPDLYTVSLYRSGSDFYCRNPDLRIRIRIVISDNTLIINIKVYLPN